MEIGEYGYKKPELVSVSEQIYEYKEENRKLEFKLSSEQFHYSYIPKREKLVRHEVIFRLLFIIPLTLMLLICISYVGYCSLILGQSRTESEMTSETTEEEWIMGYGSDTLDGSEIVVMLLCLIMLVFGGYADIRLLIREFRLSTLLITSTMCKMSERVMQFTIKHGINTFQNDEYKSKEKIKWLETQIELNENKISALMQRRQKILEEKIKEENSSIENQGLSNNGLQEHVQDGKFTLRKINMGTLNAAQLHEFYLREEQNINQRLIGLDGQLQRINKKIIAVEEDFEEVKRKMKFSLIIFVFLIVIQSTFSGIAAVVTNFICLIVSLIYIFYAESKWEQPILLYLIENDSKFTREYAFCNKISPVKVERDEVLEEINDCKKELADIKEKKESIIFS